MRDQNKSMTPRRTGGRTFSVTALALMFLATLVPGPPALWAQDTPAPTEGRPTIASDTQALLVYTEDLEPAEIFHGGGMVGVINSIFAGETEAPLTAFFRIPISPKLQTHKDAPWRVSLNLGESEERIGDDIQEAPNLSAEAEFMVSLLKDWHKDLSEEDAEQLRESGSLKVTVEGPMDALQTWTGPETLTVTVHYQKAGQVRDVRFMRKSVDWGFLPVSVVLPYDPFYVEARFKTPPDADEEVVMVSAQRVVVRQTAEDPKVYRSGELYLSPISEEQGDGSATR